MNWLAQNWRKASLAIVIAVGIALPALAAYEKTGVFTPPGHHVKLGDNSALRFGDGGGGYSDPTTYDVTARWDGTDLDWIPNSNNTVMKFGTSSLNFDLWLYGANGYLLWDASADDLFFRDSVSAKFGNDGDVEMRWDGTDFDVLVATDDYAINFGNGTNSPDLKLFGNTTSTYALWDASADDFLLADNTSLKLGNDGDVEIRWDGTDLDILVATDDYVVKLGTGTNSADLWIYGNTSADYLLSDASANNLSTQGDYYIALNDYRHGVTSIAADKTVAATESGTVFYVTGGSGVTFTLPSPAAGLTYEMCNVVNQNLTVSASPDLLVAFNNASASTVAFATSNEKIGGCMKVVGTAGYFLVLPSASMTVTVTD